MNNVEHIQSFYKRRDGKKGHLHLDYHLKGSLPYGEFKEFREDGTLYRIINYLNDGIECYRHGRYVEYEQTGFLDPFTGSPQIRVTKEINYDHGKIERIIV